MKPTDSIRQVDPLIADLIDEENIRQRDVLRLIPSENYASAAVLAATGSCMTNKYSEGYANRRYYQGQSCIDRVETAAIERAKKLFGVDHVNVQPYSGSPANLAIYFALLQQGDTILSMSLPHGGHLTHGWKVTISGHYYQAVQYGVRESDQRLDMDEVKPTRSRAQTEADHLWRIGLPSDYQLRGIRGDRSGGRCVLARGYCSYFGFGRRWCPSKPSPICRRFLRPHTRL